MTESRKEFGKRRPLPPPPATPPVKRSGHVALLLMGTLAVGGTAYALMPHEQRCPQQTADASSAGQAGECTTRHSGGSGGGGSTHWGFSSGTSDAKSSSAQTADASSSHVSRGGFGGFAHAFGFARGG